MPKAKSKKTRAASLAAAASIPARVSWTADRTAKLIAEVMALKESGVLGDGSTLTKAQRTEIAGNLRRKSGFTVTDGQIKNHLDNIKAWYRAIKKCKGKSGWGWDEELFCIIVDSGVFEEAVKLDKTIKNVRKPFPWYEACVSLWESSVATGEFATSLGADDSDQNSSDEDPQEEQDESLESESGAEDEVVTTPLATPTPKPKAAAAAKPQKISAKMLDQMTFAALEKMLSNDLGTATSAKPAPSDIEAVMAWAAGEFDEDELVDVLMHFREHPGDAKLALAMASSSARKSFIQRVMY